MPSVDAAADTTDDELPIDMRIAAALTLTTDTPSATAIELLEDRRIALRWRVGLSIAGFALLTLFALASGRIDGTVQLVVTLIALGVALGGGLRGWWIDDRRLMARHADTVFSRRERLLLLGGVDRGRQPNRTPVPLLRELARWRVEAAVPDMVTAFGALIAFYLPGIIGNGEDSSWWRVVGGTAVALLAAGAVFISVRQRRRCRRFLADSAGWPSAEGTASRP